MESSIGETDNVFNRDVDSVEAKLRKEGISMDHVTQDFLEGSELGDAASLRQRLANLSSEEAMQLTRRVDQQGNTGLLLASRSGDVELVQVLLSAGSNPNEADGQGVRSLHYAAQFNCTKLAEVLLHACAETNARDDVGETPLMWAAGAGRQSMIRLLVAHQADAWVRNNRGETPLMQASRFGAAGTVQELGQMPGANLEIKDASGRTAHALAVEGGHFDVADVLVKLGAAESSSAPARVLSSVEALHEAAKQGNSVAVSELLGSGKVQADSELEGETALLHAATAGHTLVVEALLSSRADPERTDGFEGETPLWRATLNNRLEVIWLLLEARVDPSRGISKGTVRTPCQLAQGWGFTECAELLRAASGDEEACGPEIHYPWGGPVIEIGRVKSQISNTNGTQAFSAMD